MGLKEALISDKIALLGLRIVLYKEIITINQFMKEGGLSKYTHGLLLTEMAYHGN